jgi:hypothetical protein
MVGATQRHESWRSYASRMLISMIDAYCDGAEWHGGTVMLISQFMGRLARANRGHETSRIF